MSQIEFQYSKTAVSNAGISLLDSNSDNQDELKKILDNWRACHIAPLSSFQTSLKYQLKKIDNKDALVSQRLKRYPSILSKLERNPGMKLARMQDVGGIRAVVKNMQEVRRIESAYKNGTRVFTKIAGGKDYINFPKGSGYRSVHMIFKCRNGFSIELQIRTTIQHAWATAVETMGTFLDYSLKSSEGPEEWLKFFSLASSAFAILESTPRAPEHDKYSAQEVYQMLINKEQELDVIGKLTGFRVVARHIENDQRKGDYHLIVLDLERRIANIRSFAKSEVDIANIQYSEKEQEIKLGANLQVVLVTSQSIKALKQAYPSYFLDAELFIKQITSVKKNLDKMK
jgi:ppGpp synthetase/RelA/SpoT-type nucleotidyltranferase